MTIVFGLSQSICFGTPPKYCRARSRHATSVTPLSLSVNSTYAYREYPSSAVNARSGSSRAGSPRSRSAVVDRARSQSARSALPAAPAESAQELFELRDAAVVALSANLAHKNRRFQPHLAGLLEPISQIVFVGVQFRRSRLARAVLAVALARKDRRTVLRATPVSRAISRMPLPWRRRT